MRHRIAILYKRFSLFACIFLAILWARSYTVPEALTYTHKRGEIKLAGADGRLVFGAIDFPAPQSVKKGFNNTRLNDLRTLGPFDNIDSVLNTSWLDPPNNLRRYRTARSHLGPFAFQSYAWSTTRLAKADTRYFSCHFWTLFLLLSLPFTVDAMKRLRRSLPKDPNLCPHCRYDIRATPTRCPECGSPITTKLTPSASADPV